MNKIGGTDHVFVNGNLARLLLSTYILQPTESKNPIYKTQALGWCDTFTSLQADLTSSHGNPAGYWGVGYGGLENCSVPLRGDCAHSGDIYFGDTGTAVTALALCWWHADDDANTSESGTTTTTRKANYLSALQKYATFVLEGSLVPPYNKKGTVASFINAHTGSVGCGYYKATNRTEENCANIPGPSSLNCPSVHPYTIATGTTGGAFFAQLYAITGNVTYANVAYNAMQYDASVVLRDSTGEVPYILDGTNCTTLDSTTNQECQSVGGPWPFDTISYVVEGLAAASLHLPKSMVNTTKWMEQWKPTVDFLLKEQNNEGFWGVLGSGDLMRSPRCLTLLSWWVKTVDTSSYRDTPVHDAIDKYLVYLMKKVDPEYGLKLNTITTGMVGLAVSDALSFGSTFGGRTSAQE